jgi:hypothetical protein
VVGGGTGGGRLLGEGTRIAGKDNAGGRRDPKLDSIEPDLAEWSDRYIALVFDADAVVSTEMMLCCC